MQTRLRRCAHARALVLYLFLCACASDEPEPEVASATSALHGFARETLLRDDFEEGVLASPPWTSRGAVEVREDAAQAGEFGVRLGAGAVLGASFTTRGRAQLRLIFDARAEALRGFEALRVEIAVGEHAYFPIATVRDCDGSRQTVALPRLFEGRGTVRIRFVVATYGKRRRDDAFVDLDNITVTAAAHPVDAGDPDAGDPDAGAPDADVPDADIPDADAPDATVDGGAPDARAPDASAPDAGTCASDSECSNASVCDGQERCEAGRCVAGAALRCDDGVACTADRCDPTAGCMHPPGLGLPCENDGVCDAAGACVACVPPTHTYDAIQIRIFDSPRYVCTSCHRAGGRLLDLSADNSYAALLGQTGGRAVVIPYNVETSVLHDRLRAKVEGTLPVMGGNPMPRGNAPAITRAELAAIAAWIEAGAPRNGVVAGTERALCVPGLTVAR